MLAERLEHAGTAADVAGLLREAAGLPPGPLAEAAEVVTADPAALTPLLPAAAARVSDRRRGDIEGLLARGREAAPDRWAAPPRPRLAGARGGAYGRTRRDHPADHPAEEQPMADDATASPVPPGRRAGA